MSLHYNPNMLPKIRSEGVMKGARGKSCTLRIASFIPGLRCSDDDTTVGTHLPIWGKGTSTKTTDAAVVYGCFNCHNIIDGPDQKSLRWLQENYPAAVMERMLHALTETQALQIQMGILVYPDAVILR